MKYLNQLIMGFSTLLPWSLLFWQLSTIWEINEQYSHGFIVPVIMIYLILKIPSLQFMTKHKMVHPNRFLFCVKFLAYFILISDMDNSLCQSRLEIVKCGFFLTVLLFSFLCIYMWMEAGKKQSISFPLLFCSSYPCPCPQT